MQRFKNALCLDRFSINRSGAQFSILENILWHIYAVCGPEICLKNIRGIVCI